MTIVKTYLLVIAFMTLIRPIVTKIDLGPLVAPDGFTPHSGRMGNGSYHQKMSQALPTPYLPMTTFNGPVVK